MDLPVMPPVAPMLAKLIRELPVGPFVYEPKWDGFRCIVFRDGDHVELGSRNERPLTRYFPEVVAAIRSGLPERCVVDGEIVVAGADGLDFDALQQRIHPAESRVQLLASQTPGSFVAFDLLALGTVDLRPQGFAARRRELVAALGVADPLELPPGKRVPAEPLAGGRRPAAVHVTPATSDVATAQDWFSRFEGAGLDGVVAKAEDLPYLEDKRVMWKVKHERTAEFVVAGFRWYKGGEGVGSLLLGLYDHEGQLHHVGVIGAFPAAQRRALVEVLAPYRMAAGQDHPWGDWASWAGAGTEASGQRLPGAVSRWNAKKDLSFEPLSPELVVEAAYEHLQGTRLRHTARFGRWRPDRDPRSCTYAQLETTAPYELGAIFAL